MEELRKLQMSGNQRKEIVKEIRIKLLLLSSKKYTAFFLRSLFFRVVRKTNN